MTVAHAEEIAYILKGFPRLSETFIANEIHLLESLGIRLRIYSVKAGELDKVHQVVGKIRAPVVYLPEAGPVSERSLWDWLAENLPRFAAAHRALLAQRPLAYLRTLALAVGMSLRYRGGALRPLRKVFIKEFVQAGAIAADVLATPAVRHLHGHFCHGATTIAWFVAGMTGLAFSFTAHAKDIYQKKLNPGDLLARKMRAARFVATCTGANARHLCELGAGRDTVRTIYHGLDVDQFRPPARSRSDALPLVLSVGRFVEKKGFQYFVEACARLAASGAAFRALIVGEHGEDYERIARMVAEHGLEGRLALHGPVSQEELRRIYEEAAVFALPCQTMEDGDRDGIPNVLAEAMAMGVPVVSTPISGVPELIDAGRDGLLVPARDGRALAEAIRRLLDSPELSRALASSARAKICERFDSRKTTRALHSLFLDALRETPGAPQQVPA